MRAIPGPWRIPLLMALLCLAVAGVLEHGRRGQAEALARLEQQLQAESKKVNSLRSRQQALEATRTLRADLRSRLIDPARGEPYSQQLMALVEASRTAGANLGRLTFKSGQAEGTVPYTEVTGTVAGQSGQIIRFLALVEEGGLLAQVDQSTWSKAAGGVESLTFRVRLYGPITAAKQKS